MKDHRRSTATAPAGPAVTVAPAPEIGAFGNAHGLSIVECAQPGEDLSSSPYLIDCGLESDAMASSLRPRSRPESWMDASLLPRANPGDGLDSSLRPVARPDGLTDAPAEAAAAEEHAMAGMLEVLPAGHEGERLPHQVTQEEYDATLALYDQIASGGSNLSLLPGAQQDMTPEEFHAAVMNDIAKILTTDQGRGLLTELATSADGVDHEVIVAALSDSTAGSAGPVDADSLLTNPGMSQDHGAMLAAVGIGTDALVGYAPDTVQDFRVGGLTEQDWAEFDSSTMLFHELVHAWEIHNGTYDVGADAVVGEHAVGPYDGGVLTEEYEAVGLGGMGGTYTENGYRAERGLVTGADAPLRDSYLGATPAERMKDVPAAMLEGN